MNPGRDKISYYSKQKTVLSQSQTAAATFWELLSLQIWTYPKTQVESGTGVCRALGESSAWGSESHQLRLWFPGTGTVARGHPFLVKHRLPPVLLIMWSPHAGAFFLLINPAPMHHSTKSLRVTLPPWYRIHVLNTGRPGHIWSTSHKEKQVPHLCREGYFFPDAPIWMAHTCPFQKEHTPHSLRISLC